MPAKKHIPFVLKFAASRFSLTALSLFSFCFLSSLFWNGAEISAQTGQLVLYNNSPLTFNPAFTSYLVINNSNANAIRCMPSGNCLTDGRIISGGENNKVKWMVKTSIDNYIIPFFYSGTMVPFGFNKTTAGTEVGAGTGYFVGSTWFTSANATWPATTMLCGEAAEDDVVDRFWVIDVPGYSATPTATMRFSYNEATDLDLPLGYPEADLLAQRWDVANGLPCKWERPPVGTAFPASDYVEVTTSDFSPWALVNKSKPLPISLLFFSGVCKNNKIFLTWATASETNNAFFTIERSAGGQTFESIATKQGAGNSSAQINYDLIDQPETWSETFYYRLKQTDFDGNYSYSPVIAVKPCNKNKETIIESIYNDNNGEIALVISSGEDKKYNIAFHDIIGRKMLDENIFVQKGKNTYHLNYRLYAKGIYLVRMYNNSENITYKAFMK